MILPSTGRGTGEAGGGGARQVRRPEVEIARRLRREMSLPEVLLWRQLRGGRLGSKIRRQHPIGPYVVDFFCPGGRLAIEIDGLTHDNAARGAQDAARDRFLNDNGVTVLRLVARDILRDADGALSAIKARVESPLHQPLAGLPPRAGED